MPINLKQLMLAVLLLLLAGISAAMMPPTGYVDESGQALGVIVKMRNDTTPLAIAQALVKSLALDGPRVDRFHFKPLLLVSGSVVAYGYLMKPGGLIVATIAAVVVGALGGEEFRWKEVAILTVVLVLFSWLVFVRGLTLPFPMCPEFVDNCPIR